MMRGWLRSFRNDCASLVVVALLTIIPARGLAQFPEPNCDRWPDACTIQQYHRHNASEESLSRLGLLEFVPAVISGPSECLAEAIGRGIHLQHDHVPTHLDACPRPLQSIPPRPCLAFECGENFLAPGFLKQGICLPTGAVWRPALWVFGQHRSGIAYQDTGVGGAIAEYAHRLDLFAQLNLTGTERLVVGMRPLDEEEGGARNFSSVDLLCGRYLDGSNARFQTLFFEGDIGELFPICDFHDLRGLDIGFSIGRMPVLAQQGLLLNEDMVDAVSVTRNTLSGCGNLNLRITGLYAWNAINRNSATGRPNDYDGGGRMVALLTESDFACSTVNLDGVYVHGNDVFGDLYAFAVSSIRRHDLMHNTYNTSLHLLVSIPDGPSTDYAGRGQLLFAQTSWTPHHTEDLIYLNAFWAIDRFTSPARGPLQGSPLGQTGLVFSAIGLGRYGPPLAVQTRDTAGASLGYQWFYDRTRSQVIWEVGGFDSTDGAIPAGIASALRLQKACGQHTVFVVDGYLSKHEGRDAGQGIRSELLFKF